jgi:hypothetical protein
MDNQLACLFGKLISSAGNACYRLGNEMSVSKEIGGDNTLTISARTTRGDYRHLIEVIEYGNDDYRDVHYSGYDRYEAIRKANQLLSDEEKTGQVNHERFGFEEVSNALFPQTEHWKRRYEEEAQKVKGLRDEIMKLAGRQLYMVNFTVSNTHTAYVEATSPEDAQHVVEEIYQNNYDALDTENGDIDHDIDLGIQIERNHVSDYDDVLSIEDAN